MTSFPLQTQWLLPIDERVVLRDVVIGIKAGLATATRRADLTGGFIERDLLGRHIVDSSIETVQRVKHDKLSFDVLMLIDVFRQKKGGSGQGCD
jgi:hypothetical protein